MFNALCYCCFPRLTLKHLLKRRALPDLARPRTVTEKYVWRLIFDRNPVFTVFCDKLATKEWMAENFPSVGVARVLWIGDDILDAPEHMLAGPGYLKSNNSTATNLKLGAQPVDRTRLRRLTQGWLKKDLYRKGGEWGYRDIPPKLFIEEDLSTDTGATMVEYSVYVFSGTVSHVSVMTSHKTSEVSFTRFFEDGRRMEIRRLLKKKYRLLPDDFRSPVPLDRLCETAKAICRQVDHLRVDFLWNGKALYLTELVTYPMAGFIRYDDQALMKDMSARWNLEDSYFFRVEQTGWRRHAQRWFRSHWRL